MKKEISFLNELSVPPALASTPGRLANDAVTSDPEGASAMSSRANLPKTCKRSCKVLHPCAKAFMRRSSITGTCHSAK